MAGRILIVDDVATNRIVLKVKLMAACYDVLQANDGRSALAVARKELPDLILLDIMMPDINGIDVCQKLKADPHTAHIPIVMVTAQNDSASKFQALQAGADEFLSKPLDELILLARVRSLLRARTTDEELRLRDSTCRELGFAEPKAEFKHDATIALIAPSKNIATKWKATLAPHLDETLIVLPKEDALSIDAHAPLPDLFVIASDLDGPGDGLRLLSELRSRASTRHSGIIMIVPEGHTNHSATALDLGANDLLVAGFDGKELALRLQTQAKRKFQADKLRETVRDGLRLAVIDPLTGLFNRRYAQSHLKRIAQRAISHDRHFAVMLLDLDRFKVINDTYGHAAGDVVLKEVSKRIKDNLRGVDLVARIGGEEFMVAIPDAQLLEARLTAERLCRVVNETPITIPDKDFVIHASMSIGVAIEGGAEFDTDRIGDLIDQADAALYQAKSEGRNQVTICEAAA